MYINIYIYIDIYIYAPISIQICIYTEGRGCSFIYRYMNRSTDTYIYNIYCMDKVFMNGCITI